MGSSKELNSVIVNEKNTNCRSIKIILRSLTHNQELIHTTVKISTVRNTHVSLLLWCKIASFSNFGCLPYSISVYKAMTKMLFKADCFLKQQTVSILNSKLSFNPPSLKPTTHSFELGLLFLFLYWTLIALTPFPARTASGRPPLKKVVIES